MLKKGNVRPRDPPSVWPDYQHILYPSWRPAPPPKRPHERAKLAEQRDLLASWRAREFISKSCSRLSELGFPTGWSYAETPASCACCSANFIPSCDAAASSARELWSLKSLLNGIPKFVLKIGQNLNFTAFHLDVKVSEICHKLFATSLI